MIYAAGNGTTVSAPTRPAQQQAHRITPGMIIILPGNGRHEVQSVTGMVGNVRKASTFVYVTMRNVATDVTATMPMSAHRFVRVER